MIEQTINALFALIGLAFTVGCCGAAFAFGVILVFRQMNWHPFNLVVNLNDYRDSRIKEYKNDEGNYETHQRTRIPVSRIREEVDR